MNCIFSFLCCLFFGFIILLVQSFFGGFKVGLNFLIFFGGEIEMDNNGLEVEEFGFNIGFYIGVVFNLKLIDNFGF